MGEGAAGGERGAANIDRNDLHAYWNNDPNRPDNAKRIAAQIDAYWQARQAIVKAGG